MKWSWRILRVAGIGIYVHVTFVLLPLWIGLSHFLIRHRWADAWAGVGFIFVLFVIVVLHELGHALTARRFGIRTRDITLLPIGGVARLERMPDKPKEELLVALAGPAVNVLLAAICFAIIGMGEQVQVLTQISLDGGDFLAELMWVNVALVVFNLIPAFPMDGGRVLRALLAMRLNYARATGIAARIGQAIALLFAFVGLSSLFFSSVFPFSYPFLILIGLFVWVGAAQESGMVQMRSALGGVSVQEVMITEFRTLSPLESLGQSARCLLNGWQHAFPVVENGTLRGLLTRSGVVNGLSEFGPDGTVAQAMRKEPAMISPEENAEAALVRLRGGDIQTLLVVKEGQLLGMLTSEKLSEHLMVQSALAAAGPPAPPIIVKQPASSN